MRLIAKVLLLVSVFQIAGCSTIITPEQHNLLKLSAVERTPAAAKTQSPGSSTDPSFSDENISIAWETARSQLGFILENKSGATIKLPWDEVAFVDESGSSSRVIHAGVKFISRDQPMPPSIVVKDGKLEDSIAPTGNIDYVRGQYGGWNQSKLFSEESVGKRVRVLLPLIIGDTRYEYLFSFEVGPIIENEVVRPKGGPLIPLDVLLPGHR